jgi:predicted metal-dependent HD superfamily phosphohydrolase
MADARHANNRLLTLWSRVVGAPSEPPRAFQELFEHYAEPHRYYHNLDHILKMLNEFDRAWVLCTHPNGVEFAIWFHDAIYNPKAKDNEELSAELAVATLREAQVEAPFRERVRDLILATKHTAAPAGPDACVLVDADLSILGKPIAEFDTYESAIRKEYAWVSDDAFRTGRAAVLRQFLARSRIYSTDLFFKMYENAARANIARSLEALEK